MDRKQGWILMLLEADDLLMVITPMAYRKED